KKMLESDDPAVRASAERYVALPRRRGRPRQSAYLDFLKIDWSEEDKLQAGGWLVNAVLKSTDLYILDEDNLPVLNPKFQPVIDELREQMLWRDPVLMPHTAGPPPDWTEWRARYEDRRLSKTLVSDWRPETRAEIEAALTDRRTIYSIDEKQRDLAMEAAFCDDPVKKEALIAKHAAHVPNIEPIDTIPGPFVAQHVAAVNTLQRTPLIIDPRILELMKKFAARDEK